jgi:hypothetical protein
MWAMLDKNKIVIGALIPTTPLEEIIKIQNEGYEVIPMTIENSPATIGSKYENGKFLINNIGETK